MKCCNSILAYFEAYFKVVGFILLFWKVLVYGSASTVKLFQRIIIDTLDMDRLAISMA
jgi:hypothetical protein